MIRKPQNHVTRQLDAMRVPKVEAPAPDIDKDFLAWLEALYPPRCYDHRHESLEDHIKYAGVAGFVIQLRATYEEQQQRTTQDYDDEEDEL